MVEEADAATLIFSLRISMGLTQAQFADAVGVTQSRISRWESGEQAPPASALIRMAEMCPDARDKVPSRAEAPKSAAFLRLAGVEERKANLLARAITRIRDFIAEVNPTRAQVLDLEMRGRELEENIDRALQALEDVKPDVRMSSEIPGVTERDADFFKRLYGKVKPREGRKKE